MTKKDLEKIKELINRTNDLPDKIIDGEDFNSLVTDDPKEKEKEELKYYKKRDKQFGILDDLLLETRAFIKMKFGKESEYWSGFIKIGFDSKSQGFIMNTFNINHNEYWYKGKHQLYSLLKNIEAEIKISIETAPNNLEAFEIREKKRLVLTGNLIFFFLVFLIPILVTYYFVNTLVNWETLKIDDPLSWINSDRFGKLEFLIIVFEFLIIGTAILIWTNHRTKFTNTWYNKMKLSRKSNES